MTCVSARGVRKRFGDRMALDGLDLEIPDGRIVGIIGPNGSGKTTFLQSLMGMLRVTGELRVMGHDPWRERAAVARLTSFVADVSTMPRWLRVSQAVDYFEGVHPAFNRKRTEALLERTDLDPKERVRAFSKGMVAQLQLALAMGVDARLLVLDEPTLGLDVLYRSRFYDLLLERFAEGNVTVILATHDVDEIEHVLTDIVFLDGGRLGLMVAALLLMLVIHRRRTSGRPLT